MITRTYYRANGNFILVPDRGVKTAADYYGYNTLYASSAASGYQESSKVTLHLYEDMTTGKLSLHVINDMSQGLGDTGGGANYVVVDNLPTGHQVIAADDPGEAWSNSTTQAIGNFGWGDCCTDGMVIDNIQDMTAIMITCSGYSGVDQFKLASYDGRIQYLPLTTTLTIEKIVEEIDETLFLQENPVAGQYTGSQVVSFTKAANVTAKIALNATPSNSKIIAYDANENPFIAVVDDGRGRVVFDGGFPRYYNSNWNGVGYYTLLKAEHMFLYQCMNWIVNPVKVRNGNKSILIFNDSITGENYPLSSFNTTLDGVAAIAGYTLVHKDRSSFGAGDQVTIPFVELDQYAAVIVFSTRYWGSPSITAETGANFKIYREAGNGIMVITDHSDGTTSFQHTANVIANQFGANFYGSVDRTPVAVSTLKQNYGVHPLWNNIPGSIVGGGSEGNISVTNFPDYNDTSWVIDPADIYTFNALVQDEIGFFYHFSFGYAIGVDEPIQLNFSPETLKDVVNVDFYVAQYAGTTSGFVIDAIGNVLGSFRNDGTFSMTWYDPDFATVQLTKGDAPIVINIRVTHPFSYTKKVSLIRYVKACNPLSSSSILDALHGAELRDHLGSPARIIRDFRDITNNDPNKKPSFALSYLYYYLLP